MSWKSSIDLMIEDGKTLERMYDKGWISAKTYVKYLAPLYSQIEVWRGLERMEETMAGPKYSLSGVLEGLAMRQMVSGKEGYEIL